jgi:hypothetical protein
MHFLDSPIMESVWQKAVTKTGIKTRWTELSDAQRDLSGRVGFVG